jgi:hypothetical protein
MTTKVKELPKIMDLPSQAPKKRDDEIPHWKVWAWAKAHPGISWRR